MAGGLLASKAGQESEPLAVVRAGTGETRIERSCRVELDSGLRADRDGTGALQVVGDGITVELAGELRGAEMERAPDSFEGVGIRVTGKNVTLRGARVAGYKVGIHALGADGLVLEDCDVSGNFRQRLRSTPEKEAEEDWLDPHHNDAGEWFAKYGAGIYVERSNGVTVARCRARKGQNGLVLDRSAKATIVDNDFSYLSGWGIALWRSSDNVLAHNTCNFCIRGYSHGVYNRGQDSAGILMFEQCSRNYIAANSATHCGDGFFGFAGQEALGGVAAPAADFDYVGRGNNENQIWGNDFSYAAAHGLELTFSFGNRIHSNRFAGNSICGIWAGYSRKTTIFLNDFEENGSSGYGLERGGVNIEHGLENFIQNNRFRDNACGVHLWWDEDPHLSSLPWLHANGDGSSATVAMNSFDGDELAIQLRGRGSVKLGDNELADVGVELEAEPAVTVEPYRFLDAGSHEYRLLILARSNPVGARKELAGREQIRMDEWGPIEPE